MICFIFLFFFFNCFILIAQLQSRTKSPLHFVAVIFAHMSGFLSLYGNISVYYYYIIGDALMTAITGIEMII